VLRVEPLALAAFLAALAIVLSGGSLLLFVVKGGTVTVLIAGDRAAGTIEHQPLRMANLARAARFSLERFTAGSRQLFRRYVQLGACLATVYAASVAVYLALVFGPVLGGREWTLAAALASAVLVAWITIVNLLYLLCQVVMAVDGCGVRAAAGRVMRLVAHQARSIGFIFAAILALVVLDTAASILATAALGLIAFVPFVGLAALPLQLLAWVLRGLVFQFVGLAGVVAYLRVYRLERGTVADGIGAAHDAGVPHIGRTA
jgi:hypothetical protein